MSDHRTPLQTVILKDFPYPIAVNYQRAVSMNSWQLKTIHCLKVFEITLQMVSLALISQYLVRDENAASDEDFNRKIHLKLRRPTLGDWVDIFFTGVGVYCKAPDLLFMDELKTVFWDCKHNKIASSIRRQFDELVMQRNDLIHSVYPLEDATWKDKFEDVHQKLLAILQYFEFLKNYQLIYIDQVDGSNCRGLVYRGQHVEEQNVLLPNDNYNQGWFYLSGDRPDSRKLLRLFPFFLALNEDSDNFLAGIQSDAAMIEKYSKDKIYYLAAVLWKSISQQERSFVDAFAAILDKVSGIFERQVELLQWETFKEVAAEISNDRMGEAFEKYHTHLYQDREFARTLLQQFLASDKSCLVLTGKSGIGKTSLVLAMAEEFHADENYCVILYNGARINEDGTMNKILATDFRRRINILNQNFDQKTDVIDIFASIPNIDEKCILLVVDAINENSAPTVLLDKIDALVSGIPRKYSWFKILVTSRPEAWRSITRHKDLAALKYFWPQEDHDASKKSFEIRKPLTKYPTYELPVFTRAELGSVYKKYQDHYKLKTSYEQLSPQLRTEFRDPLVLFLVSDIFNDDSIPYEFNVHEIFSKYKDHLLETGKLDREDFKLLEDELVARMAAKRSNDLTEEDIDGQLTVSGKSLYELLSSYDLKSDGFPVNISYQRLSDFGILSPISQTSDLVVSFKYERLYEYFMGIALNKIAAQQQQKVEWYEELAQEIPSKPFLWGAVLHALENELKTGDEELILSLSSKDNQLIQDVVIKAIENYCINKPDAGQKFLVRMFNAKDPLTRKKAVLIAGSAGVEDILITAGGDKDSGIRTVAVQSSYFLWQKQSQAGWNILETWSSRIRKFLLIPNTALAESCMGFSALIMTDRNNTSQDEYIDFQNPEIISRLQNVWRQIINDLLWVNSNSQILSTLGIGFRGMVLSSLLKFGLRVIKGTEGYRGRQRNTVLPELIDYFKRPSEQREIILEILENLDDQPDGIAQIESLIHRVIRENNPLPLALMMSVILLRSKYDGDQDLSVIARVFNQCFDPQHPTSACAQLLFNAGVTLSRNPALITDEAWTLYTQIQEKYCDAGGYYYAGKGRYEAAYIDQYSILEWQRYQCASPTLMRKYILKRLNHESAPTIPGLIGELEVMAVLAGLPALALEAARPLCDQRDPEIIRSFGYMLARIRLYYQELVEDYLAENDLNPELLHAVRSQNITENIWADYLISRVGGFSAKMIRIPRFREEYGSIFANAVTATSLDGWLNQGIRRVINLIYGGEVFRENRENG